jgi:hypothetical protein
MVDDEESLDYPLMIRESLRGVVRMALAHTAEHGLPGEHHFFVAFHTSGEGVRLPAYLRDLHPDEMTVVLQHQFWDLAVDEDAFSVTLLFDGARHRLTVPYAAVTGFADPSVSFGLRFEPHDEDDEGSESATAGNETGEDAGGAADTGGEAGKVISIDRFRKPGG